MTSAIETFRRVARDSGALWATTLALDRMVPIGLLRFWPELRVTAEALRGQIDDILIAWGMTEEDADITSGHMLYADLHGIDSHGCCMMPAYHVRWAEGRLAAAPKIEVVRDEGATTLMDAGGGLGHVAADTAMKITIEKARSFGVACTAVRNSWHYGAAGSYALMAVAESMIGIATTSTPTPVVVPTRGKVPLLGTNPVAFAAPAARNRPFLLDMATSTVSRGKLSEAWRRGRSIPAGWAMDPNGRAVRNGRVAAKHTRLTPLGADAEHASHKGYGLAVMVEILAALLPGIASFVGDGEQRRSDVGHFFVVIDPRAFGAQSTFAPVMDRLIDALRACEPLEESRPVLVAGDPEEAARAERSARGIPLSRAVFEDLRYVAKSSGVEFRLEQRS